MMGSLYGARSESTQYTLAMILRYSSAAPLAAIMILLLMLPGVVFGVQVENLSVPEPAKVGHTARLECKWSGQDWYSIRWYKDDDNFFTIIPKTKVKTATDVYGVTVDVDSSNEYVVFLKDVVAETAGDYKCEVMGEKPHFVTSHLTKTLMVAEIPSEAELTGLAAHYRVGDQLNISCSVHNARPAARISFYIDDQEVPVQSGYVWLPSPTTGSKLDTFTTHGYLRMGLNRQHVPRTSLTCLARIHSVEPLKVQRVILVDEPQPNHASLNTGCSSTWRCEVLLLPMTIMFISFANHILLKYS
ncbi:unnamed protein product [Meganyctiphanes norvegica]|uniref:Ig-like domain-containing protein n=1 Tax=Meganyctiphanes norvegica TaxID=48144 RepID=A0AAV2QWH1_MEGNR